MVTAPDPARLERRRSRLPVPRYPDLPVVAHREALLEAIRDHQVVVVAGETGSGKSTQLPKLCLELGLGVRGLIGHTQPRRLAARAVAERIAQELGTEVGDAVGYTVRFHDHVGEDTYIKVMTDGILLAEIQRDRDLRAYEVLLIDEAHERSLNIDFLLGYLHQLLPRRPDLKLLITSATIDTARFAAHFALEPEPTGEATQRHRGVVASSSDAAEGGRPRSPAPIIEVSGRSYPVEVRYRPIGAEAGDRRDQTQAIADAVVELSREGPGDLLVFLSGEREIRDTAEALRRLDLPHTELLPLYARLSAGEQHRVFAPHRGRRIVLATNVAETSLTVPGIVGVIDPGTARISRYSRRTKVQRLPIEPISQASADQRAGRCGRVGPGTCIRLYSEEDYAARPAFTDPEVLRTNLASVILQMAALGLGDVSAFPFVDPPDRRAVRDGILLLEELGAIDRGATDDHVRLTKLGRRLARVPTDPRLGRMVLEAERHGVVGEVLVIAAALSIQDPRERPADQEEAARQHHQRFADPDSDFLSLLQLWRYLQARQRELGSSAFRRMCQAEHLHHLRVREWQDVHSQLRQVALGLGLTVHPLTEEPDRDGIHLALLSGLLSQVGVLDPDGREYRGAREARFTIAPGSSLGRRRPSWVMAAELVETDRLRARTVAAISPDRIERVAGHLVTRAHDEPWWDPERGAAMTTERVSLYGLPLVTGRRVAYERVDRAGARALFLRHALVDGDWTTHHAFVVANQAAVAEVLDLEDRVRRDLLVDDETLWRFFDRRVPQDITTARRFDRWWRDARLQDADLLTYRQEDLLEPGAGPIDLTGFPDTWSSGELRLPLTYVRDPGHDLDGVTVDVPLALLDRVAGAGLDWQVPGHRRELVTALLRTLPKALRRHATPAPDVAAELLDASDPADGPLVEVLATALARRTGVAVVPTDLDVAALPGWLRVTYRAVDAHGRPVAWSKDLGALRRKLRDRIQQAVAAAAPLEERTGLTAWTVGDLPREVEAVHAGHAVTAYPALVDEGAAVGLRVLATPAEQASAMWAGTRRLLLLAVGAPLRTLDRGLPNATKLALAGSAHTTAATAYREVAEAAVDQLLLDAGGPVWDEASFSTLASQVRAGFAPTALALATTVGEIVATATRVEARLDAMVAAQLDETVVDVRTHLQRLVHAGWITAAGADRLPDVARYVRAVEHRVERAATKPDRDRARIAEVQALEHAYRAVAAHDLDGSVRWMLEELRVSTFAQSIGAKGSPSPQRLRAALDQLRREPRRP